MLFTTAKQIIIQNYQYIHLFKKVMNFKALYLVLYILCANEVGYMIFTLQIAIDFYNTFFICSLYKKKNKLKI